MRYFTVLLLISISAWSYSALASEQPTVAGERPFGLTLNYGGPTLLGSASANLFVLPTVRTEIGVGYIGYFLGAACHPFGQKIESQSPYLGAYYSRFKIPIPFLDERMELLYVPVGTSKCWRDGFTINLELAYMRDLVESRNLFFAGVKVGYYFKTKHTKKNN